MSWPVTFPLLLLFVSFRGCLANEFGWQAQKEFLFAVQGQDLTGLPGLKFQYAGFSYHGEIRVQTHSPRLLLVKLLNFNYTKIHEELADGWWNGPESPSKNKTKILPITTSTIVVKLTKFKSPELVIQSGLADWQVNFIKGLVSNILTFQNEDKSFEPNSNTQEQSQSRDVFSVMEDSVVGRCEVMYEVSHLPNHMWPPNSALCVDNKVLEVTKSRNYSNCQVLSEDHIHLPSQDCTPGGANCGHFWTRASVTQMIGCGDKNKFILLSSVSSSVINTQLHLQNNSQAVLNSNLNITLVVIHELHDKFVPPPKKQIVKTLLYSYSTPLKDNVSEPNDELPEEPQKQQHDFSSEIDPRIAESEEHRAKRGIRKKFGRTYIKESNERSGNSYFALNNRKKKFSSYTEDLNQSSEEMLLENQWKISENEMSTSPPHQPFSIFTLAHRTSYDLSCLKPKLRQLIADIASDLEDINILPEKYTLDKMSLAVDICRTLPTDQLTSVEEEVFEVQSSSTNNMKNNERASFRDVVTMCGTHPALQLIKGWIERRQVDEEEAAEIMSSLPSHIISPTKYYMEDFFDIVRQISEMYNQQLRSSAVLALSNTVRVACVYPRTRQHMFSSIVRPVCDHSFATRYIQWLESQMNSDPDLQKVYIQAVGNIGSPEAIDVLKNVALNSEFSSYLQTSAVFAMKYKVMYKNPEVVTLLMSLYHNYSLPVSTRMAAAALLVYSDPGLTVWQRLAISTWYDPNPAIAQFVSSSIHTMATSRDSLYAHVSKSALLVQPLTKPFKLHAHQPYNMLSSWLSGDMESLILEQLSWVRLYDFSNLYYRQTSRSSGFSRTNIEACLSMGNPDALWSAVKEMLTPFDNIPHSSPSGIPRTLEEIKQALGLKKRSMPHLQADLHFKINNMVERMLVVNKDSFKSWAKEGYKMVAGGILNGKALTYQKTDMNSFHISTTTELGFPIQFTVRTPWILKAKADVNLTGNSLVVGGALVYSSQLITSMSVLSAWDNVEHSAGTYATNFIQLPPFRAVIKLNLAEQVLKLTTTYVDQHRLLYLNMQPYTSQRKIKIHQPTLLSPDTLRVRLGQSIQVPLPWFSHYLNNIYTSEEIEHFSPFDFLSQTREVLGFSLLMPSMEYRSFETVMNPLHPVFMNFSMKSASKSGRLLQLDSQQNNITILNELFNAFFEKEKAVEEPSTAKDIVDVAISQVPKALAFISLGRSKSKEQTSDEKEQATAQEKVLLMDSSSTILGQYQVFPTTYESATGNFNASVVNPFLNKVNGSARSYLIQQALSNINSGKAVVFAFSMWSSHPDLPTKLSVFTTYSNSYSNRVSRYGLFIKRDTSEVKLTSVYEAPIDIATNIKTRLANDLQHTFFVDVVYKTKLYTINAFAKGKMGLSRAKLVQLTASPLLEACSQMGPQYFDSMMELRCQKMQEETLQIGYGNFTVYYNEHAKYLEKTAQTYLNAARVMIPRTLERWGEGANVMSMVFDVNSKVDSINAYIQTPFTSLNIYRYPLAKLPLASIVEWSMQNHEPREYCGISSRRVKTFDGAEYLYNMRDNWHLVAQDCTGKYGFSILTRPSNDTDMAVEVNIGDLAVMLIAPGPKVFINGRPQPLSFTRSLLRLTNSKEAILAHTVFTPDHSLHVHLPQHHINLLYSNTSVILRAAPNLQGRLCGLCGEYTNTGVELFHTADGLPANHPYAFFDSYMLKDSDAEPIEI